MQIGRDLRDGIAGLAPHEDILRLNGFAPFDDGVLYRVSPAIAQDLQTLFSVEVSWPP